MELRATKKHDSDVLIKHTLLLREASEALIDDTHAPLKYGRRLREHSSSIIQDSKSPRTDRVLSPNRGRPSPSSDVF